MNDYHPQQVTSSSSTIRVLSTSSTTTLLCKEEEQESSSSIATAPIYYSSSAAGEHERLLRIAEQSLLERRNTHRQHDALFLEMERRVLKEEEIEQEEEQTEEEQREIFLEKERRLLNEERKQEEEQESMSTSISSNDKDDMIMTGEGQDEESSLEEGPSAVDNRSHTKRPRSETRKEQLTKYKKPRIMFTFEERIDQLREYKKEHGTANVSYRIDKELHNWLSYQKAKFREEKLSKERAILLENEGVDLHARRSVKIHTFEERINQMREYKKQHGTVNVSKRIDKGLYGWLNDQRVKYRKGSLSKEKVSALEKEGVDFSVRNPVKIHTFEERINQLRDYKQQHGTVNVSKRIDRPLYDWLNNQRVKQREGTLSKEYVAALEKEGVAFMNVRKAVQIHIFEERINQLREYKKQHGTVSVSKRFDKQGLYRWLHYQKVKQREGTLSKEYVSVLEKEGVDLNLRRSI